MFAISLSSCSRYNANFKLDQSVFAIHESPPHILRSVRMTTHRNIVGEPRPRYLMNFKLNIANAFVSSGVNSMGELVPSHVRLFAPSARGLTLNMSKTDFMVIGSRQRLYTFDNAPVLTIEGAPIEQVKSTKSLGLHIDEHL
jgi:hypothetical protein